MPRGFPVASSGQAALRHPGGPAESCFLPDLTRFTRSRCAGPGPHHRVQGAILTAARASAGSSAPRNVDWGYREPRAPHLARSAPAAYPAQCFRSGARSVEGVASVASGPMAEYQSLYRKHRPQTFGELVGQEHVTAALRNAVKDGRVGHAYLFSGPAARARPQPRAFSPKDSTVSRSVPTASRAVRAKTASVSRAGRFLDLFELDAASNNSVDNIRDLTDSVHLGVGPTTTKKVYLIDEVHMLTPAASNTLLKTLEEPPGHVVFVLATTNPEKVLPTIRSRTQHLEFTLLDTPAADGAPRGCARARGRRSGSGSSTAHRPRRGRLGPRRALVARPGACPRGGAHRHRHRRRAVRPHTVRVARRGARGDRRGGSGRRIGGRQRAL